MKIIAFLIVFLLMVYIENYSSFRSILIVNAETVNGVATIIDADTLIINNERIRLQGIDAPELKQTCHIKNKPYMCGAYAVGALLTYINSAPVSCVIEGLDRYGRSIGTCYKNDENINEWLVRNGYALAYRQYSKDYIADEEHARSNNKGIHAGKYINPWDWRKANPR